MIFQANGKVSFAIEKGVLVVQCCTESDSSVKSAILDIFLEAKGSPVLFKIPNSLTKTYLIEALCECRMLAAPWQKIAVVVGPTVHLAYLSEFTLFGVIVFYSPDHAMDYLL